ncbi:MAG: toprim domain-containing protein, partial [Candidatus Desulfofervidus auxilii]|nr:toprim domain-containing protein [Candidatus Desulfofervidus auxilii]
MVCLFSYNNFVAGSFGDWRTGIKETFHSREIESLSPKDRSIIRQKQEEITRKIQCKQEEAKKKAVELYSRAQPPDPNHPYLVRKKIEPRGEIKQLDNALIIPLWDINKNINGLQFIHENGEKIFLKGSSLKEHFFRIGSDFPLYICEGYATGVSIYKAIEGEGSVIIAFNAGNLKSVAKVFRNNFPNADIIICSDNDRWTKGNPGVTKAIETAKEVLAKIAIPHFKDTSTKPTDFNDLYVLEGIKEVKTQLTKAEYPRLTSEDREKILNQIAELSPSEYNLVRKRIAEMLNITLTALDKEIKEIRKRIKSDQKNKKGQNKQQQKTEKLSQADILTRIVEANIKEGNVELFHTPEQESYARIKINDHFEVWPVRKKAFKNWLARQFYLQTKKAPNSQALNDALNVIEGKALYEGKEASVFVRIAKHEDNIYLDLANDKWQAVEITPDGWKVIDDPPVYFRRPKGLLPLPIPEKDGNIELLKQFLNLETEEDWILTVAWLVYALKPGSGYPVLVLYGEQGSAKSTFSKILKKIIDPSKAILKTVPRTERDMIISATNSWVLAWDNLSGVSSWLSDAFCRLSTGGGMTTRQLYSDNEEMLFEASRPMIINGITDIVNRHDLADRCISITLPPIPEEKRVTKEELFEKVRQATPYILGGLLDAVCEGLRNINHVHLDKLPRMADFALWIVATEPALPWEEGQFIKAYANNRKNIITNAVNTDVFANTLVQWFENKGHWEGTVGNLLKELEEFMVEEGEDDKIIKSKYWPKDNASVGRKLRRIASFLREMEIDIDFSRSKKNRKIILKRIEEKPSPPSPLSLINKNKQLEGDSKRDSKTYAVTYRHP